MDKRKKGRFWEEAAVCYLRQNGVKIKEQNFSCSRGEVDIIGYHQGCLVFFEVKYRRDASFGHPEEAVDRTKQRRICRCAQFYLYRHSLWEKAVRFDVIAICGTQISWYQNAFMFQR